MEIKDYCNNVESELSRWQGEINCLLDRMDHQPTSIKERMFEDVNGLHIIATELDDRIHNIRTECPIAWRPERVDAPIDVPESYTNYNDTSNVFFDYDFGG
jgi:hypothetical protein